ncbi:uncharacterized protein MONOS_2844 [Monocercomonoides exilis]|uniref:uncharacterized protein n=1 Tax=Monocercomonoides exilis TaxID=2049356 RepID=UPI00355A6D51|nr:hypothetical protein MONOS_2844 [Monocercomonoides exilis]|eukprot:MONOS_2844.1-p1 / transcript=MONOS_2844.1 / gene=MONOS_2844 / organism=Monocercomonoides_exilis_PA203 / gene_product=unspecified product / transcript_product=unspecified product / location=Mono_scaffold00061:134854-135592(+) / protein_length=205 / sequence_SO=supercontig / SO=protein_coding / is_pseudo=false
MKRIDVSSIGFGEACDEGFEQLFPFLDDDESNVMAPIQFASLELVRSALQIAEICSKDKICDIGCGDGRFAIVSFCEYGVQQSIGIEIDSDLATLAKEKVKRAKELLSGDKERNSDKLIIVEGNFFELDEKQQALVEESTLFIVYLLKDKMHLLESFLRKQLEKGARFISILFPFLDWKPIKKSDDEKVLVYSKDSIPKSNCKST